MQKWRKVSKPRAWLGGLIVVLLLAVGVQGYFIYELSDEMKTLKSADSSPQAGKLLSKPLTKPDPWNIPMLGGTAHDPFEQMQKMREEMDRLFDNEPFSSSGFFSSPLKGFGFSSSTGFEVQATEDEVVVTGKIPGADKANINVTIENDELLISSRSEREDKQDDFNNGIGNSSRHSFFSSRFEKRITLPKGVNATGIKTEFDDDEITIRIPRKVEIS